MADLRMLTGGRTGATPTPGPALGRVTHPSVSELPADLAPADWGPALHLVVGDGGSVRIRVVDALLRCLAHQGLRQTTVDDIAREAGVSRATLYRNFPGGRDAVVVATAQTEVARFFSALAVDLGAADDLEELVVAGLVTAARRLGDHRALAHLLAEEPGVVLPWLAFDRLDRVLAAATAFTAPFFARWLEAEQAARAAEWTARVLVSYVTCPVDGTDLRRPEDARDLARRFVLPAIEALAAEGRPARPAAAGTAAPGSGRD